MKKVFSAVLPIIVLLACNSVKERKILVIADGAITAQGNQLQIANPDAGAGVQQLDLKDASQKSLNVDNNGTKSTVAIPDEAGFYVLNLGKDSVYGSLLLAGRDYNNDHELDLDEQKAMIDSLQKVLKGQNISEANKNYLLIPGKLVKLTDDLEHTRVFAPFEPLSMNIDAPKDGKPPVLYKFYSKDELQSRLQAVEESYNATH